MRIAVGDLYVMRIGFFEGDSAAAAPFNAWCWPAA